MKISTSIAAASSVKEELSVALIADNWNDWYAWKTMFSVHVFTVDQKQHHLGSVKIGEKGAKGQEGQPYRPQIQEGSSALDPHFISLGQDENYYNTLKSLSSDDREEFLLAMRDCAFDTNIYDSLKEEEVVKNSLMRSVTRHSLFGRYHRLATGNADLTKYRFNYHLPYGEELLPDFLPLRFEVTPESKPPTNVHVLIGRNAVGKTRALNLMVRALVTNDKKEKVGAFEYDQPPSSNFWNGDQSRETAFSGLVSVSFSAFDRFGAHAAIKDGLSYQYIGLKKSSAASVEVGDQDLSLKNLGELADEFAQSAAACRIGKRAQAWRKALTTLESDPLFEEASIKDLVRKVDRLGSVDDRAFFKTLSSGHGIVLLIVSRLVELVEEQTLVLIDEPETHLHPPLLSAFVRAISSHLIDLNGVAIIATHSPVVLQEVPLSCVWKLTRSGIDLKAERPETETFGENVGTLTREVFGLEVIKSGFHELLASEVASGYANYENILMQFDKQLGAEARSVLRAMVANKENEAQL